MGKTDNVDKLIDLMRRYTTQVEKLEVGEQDATSAPAGGGGAKPKYPTVTKWGTGLTRGVANTLDPKSKWNTLYTIKRGKGNTLI